MGGDDAHTAGTGAPRRRRSPAQLIGLALGPIAAGVMLLIEAPAGCPDAAWTTAALAVLMATWWSTEALPLPVTALLPVPLVPALGIADIATATAPYANPLVFLFLGGFLLAAANLGPLLPAYFHTFERDTERYIGGLSMVLGVIFTVRLLQMALFTDLLTAYRVWLGSAIAVVTIAGLLVGTYLRRLEVDEDRFNWFVVALLFLIALNILRNTIPALFL